MSARARTMSHLSRLLAASAAVAGVAEQGCHKENLKQPSPPDAGADTTQPNLGYTVVDPMPTPAYCPDIAPLLTAKVESTAQGMTITLSGAKDRPDFKYVTDAAPVVYTGVIAKSELKDKSAKLVFAHGDGGTSSLPISFSLKAACLRGPVTIAVYVSDPGTGAPTAAISEY